MRNAFPHRTDAINKIPLLCTHQCRPNACATPCARIGTCERTSVFLEEFHLETAARDHPLVNGDTIVTQDLEFALYINFPMQVPCVESLRFARPPTVFELLHLIKQTYARIYAEEEDTIRTPTVHTTYEECMLCKGVDIDSLIRAHVPTGPITEMDPCAICLEMYKDGDEIGELTCHHHFHRACVRQWMTPSDNSELETKNKCPLCRTPNCEACTDGRVRIEHRYGTVPPQHRHSPFRNPTDGKYRITRFDMHMLGVTDLIYNPVQRMLYVNVYGRAPSIRITDFFRDGWVPVPVRNSEEDEDEYPEMGTPVIVMIDDDEDQGAQEIMQNLFAMIQRAVLEEMM